MESKHAGDDGKPGLGSTSPLPSSVNAGDRQRPLFPFNFDLSAEGDRRSRDAAEEKDRRVREADDRDRQSREQKAGLLPLQGLGQQTAAPPSKPGLGNTSPLPSSVNATDRSPFSFNFDVSAEGERRNRDAAEEKDRRVRELDDRDRQTKEQKAGLLPLQHKFVFWYTRRTPGVRIQFSYEDSMKKISEFSTAEGFWSCYCHLTRASNLPNPTDFHLFKEGIRPLWEDTANRNGGKWIIRFKKLVSGRFWEDLVLAMIGDQLDYGDTVCGAVLSIRFGEDILSVWNRNAADNQAVMSLRDSIKRHLHLPVSYLMEYKPHDASLRDNSSFRNTWLRG